MLAVRGEMRQELRDRKKLSHVLFGRKSMPLRKETTKQRNSKYSKSLQNISLIQESICEGAFC